MVGRRTWAWGVHKSRSHLSSSLPCCLISRQSLSLRVSASYLLKEDNRTHRDQLTPHLQFQHIADTQRWWLLLFNSGDVCGAVMLHEYFHACPWSGRLSKDCWHLGKLLPTLSLGFHTCNGKGFVWILSQVSFSFSLWDSHFKLPGSRQT